MLNENIDNELLRLNIQHFAEGEGEGDGENTNNNTNTDDNSSDGTENTDDTGVDNRIPYDRFKQKVDEVNALKSKLDQIEKEQEAAKRKELEDQNKYKELYEQALETIEQTEKANVQRTKETLLTKAGYSDEQITRLVKLVEGDTDEEMAKSINEIKTLFPIEPNYADPSVNNGSNIDPTPTDGEDVGKSMFEKLLNSGKIRGFKSNKEEN